MKAPEIGSEHARRVQFDARVPQQYADGWSNRCNLQINITGNLPMRPVSPIAGPTTAHVSPLIAALGIGSGEQNAIRARASKKKGCGNMNMVNNGPLLRPTFPAYGALSWEEVGAAGLCASTGIACLMY